MASVTVREPIYDPRTSGPSPTYRSVGRISVNAAAVALDLGRALRNQLPYTFRVWLAEYLLLLGHLRMPRAGDLALHDDFENASLQVKRFVVESIGTCIALAVCRSILAAPLLRIVNLDVASSRDPWMVAARKPRPDIAVEVGANLWIAGEARGRSAQPPQTVRIEQRNRITELDGWAQATMPPSGTALTKWFMSWAWLQTSGTTVDFFDPGAPTPFIDQRMASHLESERAEAIWETAPRMQIRVSDREVRGATVTLPLTTVPTDPRWVYLGAMSGSGSHSLGSGDDSGIDSAVAGRLVALVGWDQPPSEADLVDTLTQAARSSEQAS